MEDKEVEDPLRPLSEVFEPDQRQSNLVGTLEDRHRELSAIRLHDAVPVNVRQLFETAKNVSLYTWFVYRFHQVAEMVGYAALEMALRIRLDEDHPSSSPLALSALLRRAQQEGLITTEGFQDAQLQAHSAARLARIFAEIAQITEDRGLVSIEDPTQEDISLALSQLDLVTPFVDNTPKRRNRLAHGSATLMPSSTSTLRSLGDVINQLFPRDPKSNG